VSLLGSGNSSSFTFIFFVAKNGTKNGTILVGDFEEYNDGFILVEELLKILLQHMNKFINVEKQEKENERLNVGFLILNFL
jgi:hypothetical protein